GEYSVAVQIADQVYLLPTVLGVLLFPRLSAMKDRALRRSRALQASAGIGGSIALIGVAAVLFARPVILHVFGKPFLPAVPAVAWIMPGTVALSINSILMNYFAAEGMPPITVYSPAAAAILNVVLNIALLPRLGIVGASIASTVAYSAMLAASLTYIALRRERVPA
ncbi:MAG TPA: polysaccharide biosynthesis C-terminal domain-containing protein, partial [Chthonomonadales bacterium]|nr:polysaccharide biosynthesis C-terminal domain-containing protein [Chthonomonadales bacterium]